MTFADQGTQKLGTWTEHRDMFFFCDLNLYLMTLTY